MASPEVDPLELRPRRGGGAFRDRIVDLRRVRAADLAEHPRNWRRHPERQRETLRALLAEIGYADALLAYEQDGRLVLVDGHLRRSLDPDQIAPVLVTDLTEEEADLVLATLDPLAGLAQADPDRVAALHGLVGTSSEAVRQLLADVARSAGVSARSGLTDPDDVPALPSKPRTRAGDLWRLGPHRLLCADSTDPDSVARLTAGELAKALWTDPPYGVAYTGKTPDALRIANDEAAGLRGLLDRAFAAVDPVLRPGAAIYVSHPAGALSLAFGEAFVAAGWRIRQTLVWVKDTMVLGHGDYHYRHEPILYGHKPGPQRFGRGHRGWYGGNAETSVFEIPRPRASREHPTTKPVELVRRCLANSSGAGDLVLDPFLGSGTTLIAAHQLDRRCFGIELDPRYVDVAVTRWEAFTGERAERS
jgi:DNA modification methylase